MLALNFTVFSVTRKESRLVNQKNQLPAEPSIIPSSATIIILSYLFK